MPNCDFYAMGRDAVEIVRFVFPNPAGCFTSSARSLEGYLDCGLLCRGFALLRCENADCGEKKLVAFSCKGRGFCPSCFGRRMAQTAANLIDHVLPQSVPLRQFVLTVPFELRARLAYDGKLCGAVGRIFVDSVLRFYRRKLRDRGVRNGQSGAVTVIQTTSADLRLNPHYHALLLDGVFTAGSDGEPVFHALPELESADVADLMQVIRVRVLRYLVRSGVIDDADELTVVDSDLAEREPALAALAHAAVSALVPAGPERRERSALALRAKPGVEIAAPLSVVELGFSLHAATTAGADDARARESLVRYVLRPPIAQERLKLLPDELVPPVGDHEARRIELRRPFRDGTVAIDLDPLSLICRLAASVPPPKLHVLRYAGVLGAAHKMRARVVPPPPECAKQDDEATSARSEKPATHRSGYRPWAELLKRTFSIHVEKCEKCGARMKLRALVTLPQSIDRFLRHIGESTEPPPLAAARVKSRVVRRKLGELDRLLFAFDHRRVPRGGRTEARLFYNAAPTQGDLLGAATP